MEQAKTSTLKISRVWKWTFILGCLVALCGLPVYALASLGYAETKGPFKNWTQVVDWEGDGDLDVIISHTRWEDLDLSWAGIGVWINQGGQVFALNRDRGDGSYPFGGFAAGAGDVDQDGDLDVFTQDSGIRLMMNKGGAQAGQPGEFASLGGIQSPPAYSSGYRDMGGTITMGDLNSDGRVDAFVAGCCYGMNAWEPGDDLPHAPSISWVWINDGSQSGLINGHNIPLDFLAGRPIRQAALGDLDGDGDADLYAAVGEPSMGTVDDLADLILLNDGTGRFTRSHQPLGAADSTSVALGDVNGDGALDALVGTSSGAALWINQGQPPGSAEPEFSQSPQSFAAPQDAAARLQAGFSAAAGRLFGLYLPYGSLRTRAVFLSDLDGDGDLDGLLARIWGAEIWWNDGDGNFSRWQARFGYREDTGVAVADFDGDGDADIFSGRNEDDYTVWWNEEAGLFTPGGRP